MRDKAMEIERMEDLRQEALEEVSQEGYDAYVNSIEKKNPYADITTDIEFAEAWDSGWEAADDKNWEYAQDEQDVEDWED